MVEDDSTLLTTDEEDEDDNTPLPEDIGFDDRLEFDDSLFGTDYDSTGRLTDSGDIGLVTGLDNAKQNIRNWLLTDKGFYPSIDEEYGSEIREALGEDVNQVNIQAVIVYVENALKDNPRVESIDEINTYITVNNDIILQLSLGLVNGSQENLNVDLSEL